MYPLARLSFRSLLAVLIYSFYSQSFYFFMSKPFAFLKDWQSPLFREGVNVSAPTLFGMAAWGMVVGVAMIKVGLNLPQALGMTLIVFAGSAQLAALPLIAVSAPIWVIFVTALVVNLRFLILSALIAPRFVYLSWKKRTLLGFLTGDITVGLFLRRFPEMWNNDVEAKNQLDFLSGLLVPNWLAWQVGSISGILIGSQIPASWGLGFAGTLAVLCVMLPLVQNRAGIIGIFVASAIAIIAHSLPYKLGMLLGVVLGMVAAMAVEELGGGKTADAEMTEKDSHV
jgi:predicted branched-subunit amino acid permease